MNGSVNIRALLLGCYISDYCSIKVFYHSRPPVSGFFLAAYISHHALAAPDFTYVDGKRFTRGRFYVSNLKSQLNFNNQVLTLRRHLCGQQVGTATGGSGPSDGGSRPSDGGDAALRWRRRGPLSADTPEES